MGRKCVSERQFDWTKICGNKLLYQNATFCLHRERVKCLNTLFVNCKWRPEFQIVTTWMSVHYILTVLFRSQKNHCHNCYIRHQRNRPDLLWPMIIRMWTVKRKRRREEKVKIKRIPLDNAIVVAATNRETAAVAVAVADDQDKCINESCWIWTFHWMNALSSSTAEWITINQARKKCVHT